MIRSTLAGFWKQLIGLVLRRTSRKARSIALVVRGLRQWALGQLRKFRSSSRSASKQLPAPAGLTKGSQGLVIAQPAGEADKDGRPDCAPCPADHLSAGRGGGHQGAVCCHSRADNSVTPGTWIGVIRTSGMGSDRGEISALTRSRGSDEALGREFWVLPAYTLPAPSGAGLWGGLTTGPNGHIPSSSDKR